MILLAIYVLVGAMTLLYIFNTETEDFSNGDKILIIIFTPSFAIIFISSFVFFGLVSVLLYILIELEEKRTSIE